MTQAAESLTRVALYERTIAASLERIWENVLDWEHLPWLHRSSFLDVQLRAHDPEGWRALVALAPGAAEAEIDVRLDRPRLRYLTSTYGGYGAGTEILTRLEPTTARHTRIAVEFAVPGVDAAQADAVGAAYVQVYTRLWDEDEAMMVRRQTLLDSGDVVDLADVTASEGAGMSAAVVADAAAPVALGPIAALRRRLPLIVRAYGRSFRLVAVDGTIVAYTTVCPHLGGPLAEGFLEDGHVTCPWHGYRFDIATGANLDGRPCRLPTAPRVHVDPESGEASLSL